MTNQFEGMSYVQLADHITEAIGELKRKAYGEGYRQGNHDARYGDGAAPVSKPPVKERKPTRAEVVRKAKADVEDLKMNSHGDYLVGAKITEAEFIVNNEKRAAVVLLRGFESGIIHAKGIAKCALGDCFNADLGRAIALRRALGLDVPTEYTNAPKPEGIEVGDVVEVTVHITGNKYANKVSCIGVNRMYYASGLFDKIKSHLGDRKVIDDSARNY